MEGDEKVAAAATTQHVTWYVEDTRNQIPVSVRVIPDTLIPDTSVSTHDTRYLDTRSLSQVMLDLLVSQFMAGQCIVLHILRRHTQNDLSLTLNPYFVNWNKLFLKISL
jgi:hypothetical protein